MLEFQARHPRRADRRARRGADEIVLEPIARSPPGHRSMMISHNLNDVFQVADRLSVLYLGRMVRPARRRVRPQRVELMATGASLLPERFRRVATGQATEGPWNDPSGPRPATVPPRRHVGDPRRRAVAARQTPLGASPAARGRGCEAVRAACCQCSSASSPSRPSSRCRTRCSCRPATSRTCSCSFDLHAARDGRGVRPAARRDRPVDRLRVGHRRCDHCSCAPADAAGRGGPPSPSHCSRRRRSARCTARSSRRLRLPSFVVTLAG